MEKQKVRRIVVDGQLPDGVSAKDLALHIIHHLGAKYGLGYVYEFAGTTIDGLSMEERMTLCNMSVEGGARCGYVNPDETTFNYLKGKPYAPKGADWDVAVKNWANMASDADAQWDDECHFDASEIQPMITWGTSPDQSIPVSAKIPDPKKSTDDSIGWTNAQAFMGVEPGSTLLGKRIDTAFIGSCTNGRLSDLRAVADYLEKHPGNVAPHVNALIVPGSRAVRQAAIDAGLDKLFIQRGFAFRDAGCSLCCGMNADRLSGNEICASSSNRNFRGRQGSPEGRTLLMSPVMVAAAAIAGEITLAN